MKLLSDKKLSISVEEMNNTLYVYEVWSGVHTSTVFRNLIAKSLDLYKKYLPEVIEKNDTPYLLLLADVTKIELISAKDIDWLTNEINPQYEELGFTHQAVIQPQYPMAKKTVAEYKGEINGFITEIFDNELVARRWFVQFLTNAD